MQRLGGMVAEELDNVLLFARHGMLLAWRRVRRSEVGEGVISAAIAVLVMAFLGAAMWIAFNGTMHSAQSKVDSNVNSIGSGGTGAAGGSAGGTGLP